MAKTELNPMIRLLLLALITIGSVLVFTFIAVVLLNLIYGISPMEISNMTVSNPAHLKAYKLLQLINAVSLFIVPPLIIAYIGTNETMKEQFSLRAPSKTWMYALVPILAWAATPVINLIGEWNQSFDMPQWVIEMEERATGLTEAFMEVDTINGLIYNIILVGIIPGFGEELFFRGAIQPMLTRWTKNHHIAIWITAILFSALHMQFMGFFPRLLLGVLFGYLFVWSGSLWIPALAHFTNNTTIVILYYLMGKGVVSDDIENVGLREGEMIPYVVSGLILTSIISWIFYKNRQRDNLVIQD